MNQDILVSKIVGSPSDKSWSQASSTGRLYVAISLASTMAKAGIVALGKELLEQIQREFFALDEKRLEDIKKAVTKVASSIDKEYSHSIVVATIVEDVLYIVTSSEGVVIIDRRNNLAEVARGVDGEIISFSGRIKNDDIIVLETKGFNKKISNKLIAEYTGEHDSAKLAENLAPFILEDSNGLEAAVIIHYKNSQIPEKDQTIKNDEPDSDSKLETVTDGRNDYEESESPKESVSTKGRINIKNALGTILSLITDRLSKLAPRQRAILVSILIIIVLILGSLFAERVIKQRSQTEKEFRSTFSFAEEKLESAKGLTNLNRGRAIEDLNSAIEKIEADLGKFKKGSTEYKNLEELLAKLKTAKDEFGGVEITNKKELFSSKDSKTLDSLDFVSFSNEKIIVASGKSSAFTRLSEEGKPDSEEDFEEVSLRGMISNESTLYLLGDSVTKVNLSNNSAQEIVKKTEDTIGISFFGSNVYLLTKKGDIVTKYSGASYTDSSYFSDNIEFKKDVVSFAISGPVYILTSDGNITKFTRGKVDNDFTLDNDLTISSNSTLYSRENLSNLYVLDRDNARLIKIEPDGSVLKQYSWLEFQNAKSFTVNSSESKAFAVIGDILYSFDL